MKESNFEGFPNIMIKITETRWQKMQELFNNAVELGKENRIAFLQNSCEGDIKLFHEIEELLKIDDEGENVFNLSSWLSEQLLTLKLGDNLVLPKKK